MAVAQKVYVSIPPLSLSPSFLPSPFPPAGDDTQDLGMLDNHTGSVGSPQCFFLRA